jgi:uncharacterized protein (UPF0332 family)
MTADEARREVVRLWFERAHDALASAHSEAAAQRFNFAVNRAYYACFYAASALLLSEGQKFVKHAGVRSALHRHLVKPGRIGTEWGDFYDLLLESRGEADYGELVAFDQPVVTEYIQKAALFVAEMEHLAAHRT